VPDPANVWVGAVLLEDLKNDQLELELENGNVSFISSFLSNVILLFLFSWCNLCYRDVKKLV